MRRIGERSLGDPMNDKIDINDLEFVDLEGEMTVPDGTSFTGYKPGQKILYLTELGGQPWMRIVTFEKEAILGGGIGLVIYVKEMGGYLDTQSLYSLEHIQNMFDSYTEKDAKRWRAIDDGITPAVMLSDEEMDKIIDDNKEWCKAYEG